MNSFESSPLIRNMIEQHGYPVLTKTTLDAFTAAHDHVVLFFTEDPARFPESNDVAMILPELVAAFGGTLAAAVIDRGDQRGLQMQYGFREWPTLVYLREGRYLGAISRVQDWQTYIGETRRILASEAGRPPLFNIPVTIESESHCQ